MNHNRSTALERSVKNYWGLKPVLRLPNLALSFYHGSKHTVVRSARRFSYSSNWSPLQKTVIIIIVNHFHISGVHHRSLLLLLSTTSIFLESTAEACYYYCQPLLYFWSAPQKPVIIIVNHFHISGVHYRSLFLLLSTTSIFLESTTEACYYYCQPLSTTEDCYYYCQPLPYFWSPLQKTYYYCQPLPYFWSPLQKSCYIFCFCSK